MALFSTNGSVTPDSKSEQTIVYVIKNSLGQTLKMYQTPASQAESFQKQLESEKEMIASSLGEKEVHIVKLEKIM